MDNEQEKATSLRFPLISDLSISKHDSDADAFGLEKKLGAVLDAIFIKETPTPFAVMLSGGWGAGKSSAMAWLDAMLKKEPDGYGKLKTVRVDTCWFYPWKYQSREDVWRGLVAEVILASIKIEDVDAAKVVKAARQFGAFLGRGFVRILSAIKVKVGDTSTTGAAADVDLKEALGGVIEEYGKHVTPQEAYFNEFEETLRRWVEDTYPIKGDRRLVVFIDDLDRCMPNIALQVLEALKLYLNVPNLVFIVGVDRTVIDRIVQKSYTDMVGEKAMGSGFDKKAAMYLDKMFQVEVSVVPTDVEVREFFEKRIETQSVWKAVPEEHRDLFKRVILELGGQTPRSIVRLVNRVVVACGRRPGEGGPALEQELQRELLDVICQNLGFDEPPQRQALGRTFFSNWSKVIRQNKDKALYFPPAELKARLERRDETGDYDMDGEAVQQAPARGGKAPEVTSAAGRNSRSKFDHLAPLLAAEFSRFRALLDNLQVARLLTIPYEVAPMRWLPPNPRLRPRPLRRTLSPDLWDELRAIVAEAQGVDPTTLTDEAISKVTELDLSGSDISDVSPLAGLTALQRLDLMFTPVSDVTPLSGLTALQELDLMNTRVSDVSPLSGLTALQRLDLVGTPVSDVTPLSGLTALQELGLMNTRVSDVSPLKGLTALRNLDLMNTPVSDVSPLAGLIALAGLDLRGTQVSDVSPLKGLTTMQTLYLMNTSVSDVSPLSGLTALRSLWLRGTQVSHKAVEELRRALPECEIVFRGTTRPSATPLAEGN